MVFVFVPHHRSATLYFGDLFNVMEETYTKEEIFYLDYYERYELTGRPLPPTFYSITSYTIVNV